MLTMSVEANEPGLQILAGARSGECRRCHKASLTAPLRQHAAAARLEPSCIALMHMETLLHWWLTWGRLYSGFQQGKVHIHAQ